MKVHNYYKKRRCELDLTTSSRDSRRDRARVGWISTAADRPPRLATEATAARLGMLSQTITYISINIAARVAPIGYVTFKIAQKKNI